MAEITKTIRLWIRLDGAAPKAIRSDATAGPGPGAVVDVRALSSNEARIVYATSLLPEPDQDKDPQGWLAWTQARRRVSPVAGQKVTS